jgi:hypothetical protein
MMQITLQMRIVVAVKGADFRKGVDGLARLCKEALSQGRFGGRGFVFRNRRTTALRVLICDGQGVLAVPSASVQRSLPPVADHCHEGGQDAGGVPVAGPALGRQSRSSAGGAGVASGRPGRLTRTDRAELISRVP